MKKYIEGEIKRLTRERKNIDAVISDFQRLEAQAANGSTMIATRKTGNLRVIDEKRSLPRHNQSNVSDGTGRQPTKWKLIESNSATSW
jgi:hypothetical protein